MDCPGKDLAGILQSLRIRPSHQRVCILAYLFRERSHPTAKNIYSGLRNDVPTLSKATIYNTLSVFQQAGLIRNLNIEGELVRYDIETREHGHFQCDLCGDITNFQTDREQVWKDLEGFRIRNLQVHCRGICPRCLINENQEGENQHGREKEKTNKRDRRTGS